jgi:hypothetical protein
MFCVLFCYYVVVNTLKNRGKNNYKCNDINREHENILKFNKDILQLTRVLFGILTYFNFSKYGGILCSIQFFQNIIINILPGIFV